MISNRQLMIQVHTDYMNFYLVNSFINAHVPLL